MGYAPGRQISAVPQVILDCRNCLGESILWEPRASTLYWVNIHAGEVWAWNPFASSAPRVIAMGQRVGALGLCKGPELVVALERGFALLDLTSERAELIAEVQDSAPTTRLNDGRVDPAGRFICGGMDEGVPQQPVAHLYSLGEDGSVATLLRGIGCANSLCWSVDGRIMYFSDMPTRRIDAFDYDIGNGLASNRRKFTQLPGTAGLPDGSVVDAEGFLWNAQWQGSRLVRYDPSGAIEREVTLPVSNPTCLAFGGPGLEVLFVSTAWFGLSDAQRQAQPHAGSLFAFRPGVRGRREHRFGR